MKLLLAKLRAVFRKEKLDRDMAKKMRFHLDERTADQMADGVSPDEASYAAQRKFGNVGVIQGSATPLSLTQFKPYVRSNYYDK
jgi:hypothetical protein